ncbi:hypothetical protein PPERSA_08337 [Pseudocohnilembus persalinus]|uniref:Transmembrane protein n=1 Tax=Pseudocohnilembus persalinus TaxID=266149 RepID=A0A0V0QPZ8_PSEPJ|nr:hypothetical protein PPERSA_08337 [Pseudocohnilembus persalinus]|eukprot:KRX04122.1 hypothetical protein PPERSA_08337 [Pseudocohnilembus persalinus]
MENKNYHQNQAETNINLNSLSKKKQPESPRNQQSNSEFTSHDSLSNKKNPNHDNNNNQISNSQIQQQEYQQQLQEFKQKQEQLQQINSQIYDTKSNKQLSVIIVPRKSNHFLKKTQSQGNINQQLNIKQPQHQPQPQPQPQSQPQQVSQSEIKEQSESSFHFAYSPTEKQHNKNDILIEEHQNPDKNLALLNNQRQISRSLFKEMQIQQELLENQDSKRNLNNNKVQNTDFFKINQKKQQINQSDQIFNTEKSQTIKNKTEQEENQKDTYQEGEKGTIAALAVILDINLLQELNTFKNNQEANGYWDYQYYVMLFVFLFTCLIGHYLGNQQPESDIYPKYSIIQFFFRFFGLVGLSPIIYLFYSSFARKGFQNFDNYCMLQLGPRKWWAHWQSIISTFVSSHFMYTTSTHSNWVVVGFIINCVNAMLAFIEYQGYDDQKDVDHVNCEECQCLGDDNMNQNFQNPYKFDLYLLKCKNCKQFIDIEQDFYYCGCPKHLICFHLQCFKIYKTQKERKIQTELEQKNQKAQEKMQKQLSKLSVQEEKQYFKQKKKTNPNIQIAEKIGNSVRQRVQKSNNSISKKGSTALILIEKSSFTSASPTRLTYDFFIWNTILMMSVLSFPYFFIILFKRKNNIRPVTLLIFYTFYYSQILRLPFRKYKILEYNRKILIMDYLKKKQFKIGQKIQESATIQSQIKNIKESLEFDQMKSLIDYINFEIIIGNLSKAVSFLGYFPAIWRIGELIVLFSFVFLDDYGSMISDASQNQVRVITDMAIGWNFISLVCLFISIFHFYEIQKRINRINTSWKSDKKNNPIRNHYKKLAKKELNKRKEQLLDFLSCGDEELKQQLLIIYQEVQGSHSQFQKFQVINQSLSVIIAKQIKNLNQENEEVPLKDDQDYDLPQNSSPSYSQNQNNLDKDNLNQNLNNQQGKQKIIQYEDKFNGLKNKFIEKQVKNQNSDGSLNININNGIKYNKNNLQEVELYDFTQDNENSDQSNNLIDNANSFLQKNQNKYQFQEKLNDYNKNSFKTNFLQQQLQKWDKKKPNTETAPMLNHDTNYRIYPPYICVCRNCQAYKQLQDKPGKDLSIFSNLSELQENFGPLLATINTDKNIKNQGEFLYLCNQLENINTVTNTQNQKLPPFRLKSKNLENSGTIIQNYQEFNILLDKRKLDPIWDKISHFQSTNYIVNREDLVYRFNFDQEQKKSIFRRAQEQIQKNTIFGYQQSKQFKEDMEYENHLRKNNLDSYLGFIVNKIHHYIEYHQQLKIIRATFHFVIDHLDNILLSDVKDLAIFNVHSIEFKDYFQFYKQNYSPEEQIEFLNDLQKLKQQSEQKAEQNVSKLNQKPDTNSATYKKMSNILNKNTGLILNQIDKIEEIRVKLEKREEKAQTSKSFKQINDKSPFDFYELINLHPKKDMLRFRDKGHLLNNFDSESKRFEREMKFLEYKQKSKFDEQKKSAIIDIRDTFQKRQQEDHDIYLKNNNLQPEIWSYNKKKTAHNNNNNYKSKSQQKIKLLTNSSFDDKNQNQNLIQQEQQYPILRYQSAQDKILQPQKITLKKLQSAESAISNVKSKVQEQSKYNINNNMQTIISERSYQDEHLQKIKSDEQIDSEIQKIIEKNKQEYENNDDNNIYNNNNLNFNFTDRLTCNSDIQIKKASLTKMKSSSSFFSDCPNFKRENPVLKKGENDYKLQSSINLQKFMTAKQNHSKTPNHFRKNSQFQPAGEYYENALPIILQLNQA